MLTQELIRSLLNYDPSTGELIWLKREGFKSALVGKRAGSICKHHSGKEYRQIYVMNRNYKEHHIVWLYMTGNLPSYEIDHIDGNGSNNKWLNLREAASDENKKNLKKYATNTSGHSGICWDKCRQKWLVRVGRSFIGYRKSIEDAIALRICALADHDYHPNHGSDRPL